MKQRSLALLGMSVALASNASVLGAAGRSRLAASSEELFDKGELAVNSGLISGGTTTPAKKATTTVVAKFDAHAHAGDGNFGAKTKQGKTHHAVAAMTALGGAVGRKHFH